MAAKHRHGAYVCTTTPKAECDLRIKQSNHFHPGTDCVMWLKPGNEKESCALTAPRKAAYLEALALKGKGEEPTSCLACEYGGPHHSGPACSRRQPASEE